MLEKFRTTGSVLDKKLTCVILFSLRRCCFVDEIDHRLERSAMKSSHRVAQ